MQHNLDKEIKKQEDRRQNDKSKKNEQSRKEKG